jgi:alpha-1,2-mannosyltransferase
MKANVVFGDLNPCGGGERVSLVTMQALLKMGINFDLTTFRNPDLSKLENAYGKNLVSIMKYINKINVVNILEELRGQQRTYDYDITINTHGDMAPYYHPSFEKDNAITYCHFPTAKYFIESENMGYLQRDLNISITSANNNNDNENNDNDYKHSTVNNSDALSRREKECFSILKYGYWNLIKDTTIIANSEFTRRAIINSFGIDNIYILAPPIDVESFRNAALTNDDDNKRDDIILVISRIDPYKQIENAIKLAKILKTKSIGKGMKIVGSLYYYNFNYYSYLKQMVIDFELTNYVQFEINACLDKLLFIMRHSKVYFHPMIGEHFGMAVVEAMAAGLIPIVPNIGGVTEFVPSTYHFSTLEQAAEIIACAFHLPYAERVQISNSVNKFSNSLYIEGFQHIVNELVLSQRRRRRRRIGTR